MRPETGAPSARSASISRRVRSGAQRVGSTASRPSTLATLGSPSRARWSGGRGASVPRNAPRAATATSNVTAAPRASPSVRSAAPIARAASHTVHRTPGSIRGARTIPMPKATASGASGVRSRVTGHHWDVDSASVAWSASRSSVAGAAGMPAAGAVWAPRGERPRRARRGSPSTLDLAARPRGGGSGGEMLAGGAGARSSCSRYSTVSGFARRQWPTASPPPPAATSRRSTRSWRRVYRAMDRRSHRVATVTRVERI